MKHTSKEQLIAKLKAGDAAGIPFAKTKKQMLSEGYSEQDITHAIYQAPYDGIPNPQPKLDPLHTGYNADPETAQRIGEAILENDAKNKRTEALAYGAASRFAPGRHAQSYYHFKFFEKLGIPFYRTMFVVVASEIAIWKLSLPKELRVIIYLPLLIWIVYRFKHIR